MPNTYDVLNHIMVRVLLVVSLNLPKNNGTGEDSAKKVKECRNEVLKF